MAKNNAYWKKRFEQLEIAQLNKGLSAYHELERQYTQATRAVEKEIAAWYSRYAKENQITLTEAKKLLAGRDLEAFRMDVKEYIRKGRSLDPQWAAQLEQASVRVHISRLEALKVQMQQQIERLAGHELDALDKVARDIYTDGYYRTAFEVAKGSGVSATFAALDTNKIDKVISKPWAADGANFSKRIWKKRSTLVNDLHTLLTQNIIKGDSPDKLIKLITRKFDVSKHQAGRLIMTESAYFNSVAQKDSFKDVGVEQFEFVATLDTRTSDICEEMDGKVFKMSEYEVGVNAPPLHCNCRSTTIPYFADLGGERAMRDSKGKYKTVPADMTYKQWKDKFVKGAAVSAVASSFVPAKTSVVEKPVELTSDEKEAVEYYVSGDGMYINHYLRDGERAINQMGEMRPEDKSLIADLDKATSKNTVKQKMLYRSVDASAVFGDIDSLTFDNMQGSFIYNDNSRFAKTARDFADKAKGKVITDKGFMSTTKNYEIARDFGNFTGSEHPVVLALKTNENTKGLDLEKFMPDLEKRMEQEEVLLHRNQRYKILDVKGKDGNIYIECEFL